jgi:hypothetical protein
MPVRNHLIEALQSQGALVVPGKRGARTVRLTRPEEPGTFYFVGRGASQIRFGRRVDQSQPLAPSQKVKLLERCVLDLSVRLGAVKQ